MFYYKAHISEFLYFRKIHSDLRKAVHRNQNTLFALCVFFYPLGFRHDLIIDGVTADHLYKPNNYLSIRVHIHLPSRILLTDHTAPAEHSSRLGSVEGVAQLKLEVEAPNVSYLMEIA